MPLTDRQDTAMRRRLQKRAAALPQQPQDLRTAIKRQIWTEDMTIMELAPTIRMNPNWLRRRLMSKDPKAIHPGLLNRIISGLEVDPREAQRWHLLAAREAGWQV